MFTGYCDKLLAIFTHPPILRRQKEILRSHGAKGGSGSRVRDGRSLRWEQLIQQWEQLIQRREQLICEKVVGLSEKSYHFLKSRTTFWWEQLIRTKFSREFVAYTANSSSGTAVL